MVSDGSNNNFKSQCTSSMNISEFEVGPHGSAINGKPILYACGDPVVVAHPTTSMPTPTPTLEPTVKPAFSSSGSSTTTSIATVDTKEGERLISGSTSIVSLTVSVLLGLVFFLI
jgi:hypothetical protein